MLLSGVPPAYNGSSPPPHYSSEPSSGEQRIQHSPRTNASPVPNGIFIKKDGPVTVLLTGQETGVSSPSYGRQRTINGTLLLDKHDNVSRLLGNLDYLNSNGGAKSISLVDQSVTLWTSSWGPFAEHLPFEFNFTLPATFTDLDEGQPLPPTFAFSAPGLPAVVVRVVYAVVVDISFARGPLSFFPTNTIIRVPFNYRPRTRPNRPILAIPLFRSIKSLPEEWTQSVMTIKTKPNVLIPSVQVFSFADTIPIHLQLTGPLTSLRQLFRNPPATETSIVVVTVSIQRQIAVDVGGSRAWRELTIGEGKMTWSFLDWEGELRAKPDVAVSGFVAAGVVVKDFILVTLVPPGHAPFLPTRIYIPIRLVTDPWIDTPDWTSVYVHYG
ncbi:hypothetical protein BDZ89DRAFT_1092010 [Hymenopellis radicata]|nr:hypothetical protein BDZ89DRAFT_1092010 [Hymenopellis radicata]